MNYTTTLSGARKHLLKKTIKRLRRFQGLKDLPLGCQHSFQRDPFNNVLICTECGKEQAVVPDLPRGTLPRD